MGGGAPVPHFCHRFGATRCSSQFFLAVPLAVADSVPFGKRAHVTWSYFNSYGPKLALSRAVYNPAITIETQKSLNESDRLMTPILCALGVWWVARLPPSVARTA